MTRTSVTALLNADQLPRTNLLPGRKGPGSPPQVEPSTVNVSVTAVPISSRGGRPSSRYEMTTVTRPPDPIVPVTGPKVSGRSPTSPTIHESTDPRKLESSAASIVKRGGQHRERVDH